MKFCVAFLFMILGDAVVLAAEPFAFYTDPFLQASPVVEKRPLIFPKKVEVKNVNNGSIDCIQKDDSGLDRIGTFAEEVQNASRVLVCDAKAYNFAKRLSALNCKQAVLCRKQVASRNLNSTSGADKFLNELIAKDYAKKYLQQNSAKIEKFELLREFALENYGSNLGAKCTSRLLPSSTTGLCNIDGLNSIYGIKNKQSLIEEKRKEAIERDKRHLEELSEMVISAGFINATSAKKAEYFLRKINTTYQDPVLGYDFETDGISTRFINTEKYKDLIQIFENKSLTKDTFIKSFNEYRKKRAIALLSETSCKNVPSIAKVCSEMTAIEEGKILPKTTDEAERLTSEKLENAQNVNELRKYLGETFASSDFDILLNAKKCISFDLTNEKFSSPKDTLASVQSGVWNDDFKREREQRISSTNTVSSFNSTNTNIATSSPRSESRVSESGGEDDITVSDPTPKTTAIGNANSAIGSNFSGASNNTFGPSSYRPSSLEDDNDEGKDANDEPSKVSSTSDNVEATDVSAANNNSRINSATEARIRQLEERANVAEANLVEMKKQAEESERANAAKEKIAKENAEIARLTTEVAKFREMAASAKRDAQRTPAASAPVIENQNYQRSVSPNVFANPYYSPASVAARAEAVAAKGAVENSAANNKATAQVGTSGSSSNKAATGGAGAILSSTSNNANKSGSGPSAEIVSVDRMSPTEVTQYILGRIEDLNGQPFYIEENGKIKKIKPKIVDGVVLLDENKKPVFEILIESNLDVKKLRAPASVTNVPDLKKLDEALTEAQERRLKYEELQRAFSGALEKK